MKVSSCSGNWICGRLDFGHLPTEDVAFAMIEVQVGPQHGAEGRRGRIFVGDVAAGPDYFREISWTLKSVNGCGEFEPAWITKDDYIMLEGPRWVTERVHRNSSISARGAAEPVVAGVSTKVQDPNPSHNLSYCSRPQASEDPNFAATLGALEQSAARPKMLPGGLSGLFRQGSKDDCDYVLATRAAASRPFPAVPRLDLSNMQSRYKNSSRRHQKGLFHLCDGLPSVHDGSVTPGLSRCTSHWLCL